MLSPGQKGYRLPASPVTASPIPEQLESRLFSTSRQPSSSKPKFSDPIGLERMRREEVKARHGRLRKEYGTTCCWTLVQCDCSNQYIRSANGESLARDDGGCSNLFMEITDKTVQGCQLCMTTSDGNKGFCLWMQPYTDQPSSVGAWGRPRLSSCKSTTRHHKCKLADLIEN